MLFWWLSGKESTEDSPKQETDVGSIPGSGSSPGEGNGYPLQYSGLENPMLKNSISQTGVFKNVYRMRHKGGILSQISVVNAANNSTQLELGHHSDVEGSSRAKNLKKNRYM